MTDEPTPQIDTSSTEALSHTLPPVRCSRLTWMSVNHVAKDENKSVAQVIRESVEFYLKDFDPEYQEDQA